MQRTGRRTDPSTYHRHGAQRGCARGSTRRTKRNCACSLHKHTKAGHCRHAHMQHCNNSHSAPCVPTPEVPFGRNSTTSNGNWPGLRGHATYLQFLAPSHGGHWRHVMLNWVNLHFSAILHYYYYYSRFRVSRHPREFSAAPGYASWEK